MRCCIEAVTVNHNTSSYMELMLRSLFARHPPGLNLSLTVFDNASVDDMTELHAYAGRVGLPIVQSGFTTQSQHNSHGQILRRFVLGHPDCTHYLFLDADVCFVTDRTLDTMLEELERAPRAFAIGPRMSWNGATELPEALRPEVYDRRLHPCCALIENTEVFRRVVAAVGLSCMKYLWAEREEYLDTCELMTRVMGTHGLHHVRSSRMVIHSFAVSYDWDPEHFRQEKAQRRDVLLRDLRAAEVS